MDKITTVGLDLAKQVMAVHGVDATGRMVARKVLRRDQVLSWAAALPPCVIAMEACGGAHHWARELSRQGHTVRIIAAEFVQAFRKSGKNDANDAEAICTAARQPNMRFVPMKTVEQQAALCVHRLRLGVVEERTALINRLRGLLTEFGVVAPLSPEKLRRELARCLDPDDLRLPAPVRERWRATRSSPSISWRRAWQPTRSRLRRKPSTARAPSGCRPSLASVPPRRPPSWPRWAHRRNFATAASSPRGSASRRSSTAPAARPAWVASPSAVMPTCARC